LSSSTPPASTPPDSPSPAATSSASGPTAAVSQAALLGVLDQVDLGVVLLDYGGHVVFINGAARRFLGFPATGPLPLAPDDPGLEVQDALGQPLTPEEIPWLRPLPPGGPSGEEDLSVRTPDGRRVYLRLSTLPVPGTGRVILFTDRTELRQVEERFRALIHDGADAMAILNAKGEVTFWSQSAERISGWTEAEALGSVVFEWVHPDDLEGARGAFAQMLDQPSDLSFEEFRFQHRDGSWRTLAMGARNLLHQPAVRGIILNARDVTESRKLEARLMHAQRFDAIGRLAGGVAHEFNNILTIIQGRAHLLHRALPEGDPRRDDVEQITALTVRAGKVTRQLLAFSGRHLALPEHLVPASVLGRLTQLIRPLIGEDIQLHTEVAPNTPPIYMDAGGLEHILLNLVLNARDAMPGGGSLTLRALPAEGGLSAVFQVEDSGSGIPDEAQDSIFEPFFSSKDPARGSGLGLPTARGLAEQAGGTLELARSGPEGTLFQLTLPAAAQPPEPPLARPPLPSERAPGPDAGAGADAFRPSPGRGARILLVEDEPELRDLAADGLRELGYIVWEAGSGEEAQSVFEQELGRFDALITDVILPGMSGGELVHELQKREPKLRVLFISGYPDARVALHMAFHPQTAFLRKPFRPYQLAEALEVALGRPG
jgi:two-component system, cell cycle sensor histidine kinase and response regulator CckA